MENNLEKEKEQKEFVKQIYTEKTVGILKIVLGILIFDFITYFIFGAMGQFDFGIFFELVTLVFVITAMKKAKEKSIYDSKKNIIVAMLPIGWLLVYDFIDLLSHSGQIIAELTEYYQNLDFLFYGYTLDLVDVTLIAIITLLFAGYVSLSKSNGEERYKGSTDWFYDQK